METAASEMLKAGSFKLVGFKNRVRTPTEEMYVDLMFTVEVEEHICEVQTRAAHSTLPTPCTSPRHAAGLTRRVWHRCRCT